MRNFFQKLLTALVATGFLALFVAGALTGCKSEEKLAVQVAVTYATVDFIEKSGDAATQLAEAREVIAALDELETLLGSGSATVAALEALIAVKLEKMSPKRRAALTPLIIVVTSNLKERVGGGVISEDRLVKVREVFQWVRSGANYFVASE